MDETEVPTGSVTQDLDMEEQIRIQSVAPMPDVRRPSPRIGIQSVAPKPGVLRPSPEIGFESVISMPREPFPSTPDDRERYELGETEGLDMEEFIVENVATMLEVLRPSMPDEHSIFRIPPGIRRVNRNAFEPEIISIGPYNDGNKVNRLKAMQDHKRRCRDNFLKRNPYYDYFEELIMSVDRARKCYSEDVNMGDEDFVNLLLLDGSFIVELLLMLWHRLCGLGEGPFDHIVDTRWMFEFLAGDLLKMENQVPFFVLQKLYPSTETPSITDLAYNFAKLVARSIFSKQVGIEKPSPEKEIQHLLHFCHSCFFAGRGQPSMGDVIINTIPTAEDLTKAGVEIKSKEMGGICEVTFSGGVLEMTPAVFYDSTDIIFHNLIALEQCYPLAGVYMTSYSYFLNSLIDTSADVRLLRQLGVVRNGLGSDRKLAQAVNNLCHNVVVSVPESMTTMFADVNNYCSHSWPTWRTKLVNDYFSNPWAIISLIAAVILLLLTVFQTVISTISYFQPPSQK